MDQDTFVRISKTEDKPSMLTPLVLIHDEGGSVSNYHGFSSTGRDIFGLNDARPDSFGSWEGGIAEVASVYCDVVESHIPGGDILLGGEENSNVLPKRLICLRIVVQGGH
jgi:hypothetical protein